MLGSFVTGQPTGEMVSYPFHSSFATDRLTKIVGHDVFLSILVADQLVTAMARYFLLSGFVSRRLIGAIVHDPHSSSFVAEQ